MRKSIPFAAIRPVTRPPPDFAPCAPTSFRAISSSVDAEALKQEATRVLESLPARFRKHLGNVVVVVEKRPKPSQLATMGLDPKRDTLYGLYEGIPLSERSTLDPPLLPDKITIFSEPLLRDFPDPDELREEIRITVLHEIAHYFGIDEDEIEDLGY